MNEISPHTGHAVVTASTPVKEIPPEEVRMLGTYSSQNPLIANADPLRVQKFSDFLSLRQLHGLDLYDLVYRPMGMEHQIAFLLAPPTPTVIGVALSRARRDFSERDRSALEALRPLAVQAYNEVVQRAITDSLLATLDGADENGSRAVILVDRGGRIVLSTAAAQAWLSRLAHRGGTDRLPAPLAHWHATRRRHNGNGGPLRLATDQGVLEARLRPGHDRQLDMIFLRRPRALNSPVLLSLGLTAREGEVLELVARGHSNARIAFELDLSARTVAKHLEHVYAKLGVAGRMAAVNFARQAWELMNGGLEGAAGSPAGEWCAGSRSDAWLGSIWRRAARFTPR